MKKTLIFALIIISILSISGCKKQRQNTVQKDRITLNYYKLFENEENLEPLFTEFKKLNPHVTINYQKFIDPEKYHETIVNEIAEGRGPDIISVPNTWIKPNYKKITPAPQDIAPASAYRDIYVEIAANDNILQNEDETESVYGIPLSVDNLALYYNDTHFEQAIPEKGKPSLTWDQLNIDAQILTLKNFETNSIIRSGLAIGRGDNILRSSDTFLAMLLQNNINIYNDKYTLAKFANNSKFTDLLSLYTSYANSTNPERIWDEKISSATSSEKELEAFVTGKASMIFGYSHLYKDILNLAQVKKRQGINTIQAKEVKIAKMPQFDPVTAPATYAKYYTETVSRNSTHAKEAWQLLVFITEKKNLETFYKKDFKPTSRRDLILTQKTNPIYSAFIEQIGYARSIPQANDLKFNAIIKELLTNIVDGQNIRSASEKAESEINSTIPSGGIIPEWSIE